MAVVAGDILEVSFNHPTLGQGRFRPKAAEDSTYDFGGFRSDDDANGVDAQGNMIDKKNRVRPFFEVVCSLDMVTALDIEKANDLAASPIHADWDITHISGAVHRMTGVPVGDLQGNPNAGTFTLKVAGGGKMKKIL